MGNKHEAYDLAQMQSLPLEAKIQMTKRRIEQWYEYFDGDVYVSFSGGKDSTVLLHIVRNIYPDVEAVYVDTGLEYPELREHVKTFENVTWLKPKKNFKEIIKEKGYPIASKPIANTVRFANPQTTRLQKLNGNFINKNTGKSSNYNYKRWKFLLEAPFKISDECCDIMKKQPTARYEKETGKSPFLGLMACESEKRKTAWMKTGCNAFEKKRPQSQPMAFWTEQDVLEYIVKYKVSYASVYGDIVETGKMIERIDGEHKQLKTTGCQRTGCMFCMFGCHLNNDQRFVSMKETHPKQYDYMMKSIEDGGLGMKEIIDWMNENGNMGIKY